MGMCVVIYVATACQTLSYAPTFVTAVRISIDRAPQDTALVPCIHFNGIGRGIRHDA